MARRRLHIFAPIVVVAVSFGASAATGPAAVGDRIAFSSNRGPNAYNSELYSVRLDGSAKRNLTRDQGSEFAAVLSPDGQRVAFLSARREGEVFVEGLYVMRVDGTGQRRLSPREFVVARDPPTWSPDSRMLAFQSGTADRRTEISDIWVVGVDGTGLRRIVSGASQPAWSPSGAQIAFTAQPRPAQGIDTYIAVVNTDGSGRRALTTGMPQWDDSPVWSPDARSLLFVRGSGGAPYDLYRISVSGTGLHKLATSGPDAVLWSQSWSPDGRSIVFAKNSAIFRLSATGKGLRRLAAGEYPAWSPNGKSIAFVTKRRLRIVRASGGRPRTLYDDSPSFVQGDVFWSRDGRRVIFGSILTRNDHEIFVVGAQGGRGRPLTRNAVNDRLPVWSPDRRTIAFVRGGIRVGKEGRIWLMTSVGTRQRALVRGSHPAWSPDGTRIAFSRAAAVWTLPVRGGPARRVASGAKPRWSPQGSRLALVRGSRLIVVELETREERGVASWSCDPGVNLDIGAPEWSPDGTQLAVAVQCEDEYSREIFAEVMAADGSGRRRAPLDRLDLLGLAWSRDGGRLAFSRRAGDRTLATAGLDGSGLKTITASAGANRDPDW